VRELSVAARVVVALEVVVALLLAARLLPVEAWLHGLEGRLDGLGPLGPVLYAAAYAAGVVVFVPGSLLTIGAGLLFGTAVGFAAASAGSIAGASLAFLVARYGLRPRIEAWARRSPRFAAIDEAVGVNGWKMVALTRLSPLFPFNALNFAYGATRIRFGPYVLASWIAMIPGTLLYVWIGSLGRMGAEALAGSAASSFRLALNVVGLAATAAVTVFATRTARAALARAAPRIGAEATAAAGSR
jgi:uncharacterized membrane protein YdjX (TVP38/TMEM64 family)